MIRQLTLEISKLGLQDFMRRCGFKVDAQQLLLAAQHAQFNGGTDVGVIMQTGGNTCLFEQTTQCLPGFIGTHHGKQ